MLNEGGGRGECSAQYVVRFAFGVWRFALRHVILMAFRSDASESRELSRGTEGPREFFVNKGFHSGA